MNHWHTMDYKEMIDTGDEMSHGTIQTKSKGYKMRIRWTMGKRWSTRKGKTMGI